MGQQKNSCTFFLPTCGSYGAGVMASASVLQKNNMKDSVVENKDESIDYPLPR